MATEKSAEQLIASGPTNTLATDRITESQELLARQPAESSEAKTPSTLDDLPFDDSRFNEIKPTIKEQPKVETKPVEKVKEELKEQPKIETTKEQPKTDDEIKPLKLAPAKEIDLSGYNETEQTFLKQMSKPARDFFAARLGEIAEFKTKLKDAEAKLVEASKGPKIEQSGMYLLDKEYQDSVISIDRISREAFEWEQALGQIDSGGENGKFRKPVGFDNQGNIVYQDTAISTTERAAVIRKLTEAQGYIDKHKTRANHIATTYGERYAERMRAVKQYEDYVFPELADEKVASANPAIKSMRGFLDKSGFGDNILSGALCKMYAFAMAMSKEAEELKAKGAVKEVVKEVRESTGPTGAEVNTGRSGSDSGKIDYNKPDDLPFDFEAFQKRKN